MTADLGQAQHAHGGFSVHFCDSTLGGTLAQQWNLHEVHAFEEGELPRRLWRVTQSKPC